MSDGYITSIDPLQEDDPAVKAMKSEEFATMSNEKAFDVALAIQQILRGQGSLLENQDKFAEELRQMKAKMSKYDEDAAKYESNSQKFIEEVMAKAEKLIAAGSTKDKIIARGSAEFAEAKKQARAKNSVDNLKFVESLRTMPKVEVTSPGVWEMVSGPGGSVVPTLYSEVVRIKNKQWVLAPGVPTMVPKVVADLLKTKARSARMNAELRAAMDGHLETNEMNAEIRKIQAKYGERSVLPGEPEE